MSSPTARLETADPIRGVSPWVKAFVAFHVLSVIVWAMPRPQESMTAGRAPAFGADALRVFNMNQLVPSPIKFYMLGTGFWQYWDMFAPNPSNTDIWVDALVRFKDGSQKVYSYPRMANLPLIAKYAKERYRKFYERINPDEDVTMWPHFAQHIAYLECTDLKNPPVMVALRRHFLPVQPPGSRQPDKYTDYIYYNYVVDQAELSAEVSGR